MNVKYDAKAKLVTITFGYDPAKAYPFSKSGKKPQVATSGGFRLIPGTDCAVSLNASCEVREGQDRPEKG